MVKKHSIYYNNKPEDLNSDAYVWGRGECGSLGLGDGT
jgi:hypothetical protein